MGLREAVPSAGGDERTRRNEQAAARRRDEAHYSSIPGLLKR